MSKIEKFTAWTTLTVLSAVVNGFVILKAFEWIIVPTFDVPKVNIIQTIGIMVLVRFLTNPDVSDKTSQKSVVDNIGENTVALVLKSAFLLFILFILKQFI